jgi:hypothetical protein
MLFLSASAAGAQWTRLDSVVAISVSVLLRPASTMHVTFDSSLQAMKPFVQSAVAGDTLRITELSATLDTSMLPATIVIQLTGRASGVETRHWTSNVALPDADRSALALETNRSRFVKLKAQPVVEQGSIWSDVLEPALVVIGSGAIVALFFLIRS